MQIPRRDFFLAAGAATLVAATSGTGPIKRTQTMYGIIGRILAVPGERDALISILMDGTNDMPGRLSFVVAKDPADPRGIWITEVWDNQGSHQASLQLPSVQRAIASGKPLIARFSERYETEPVGGTGLGRDR